ncbi:MAG: PKD domain-containing protein [bacterium]|nr:PKD domain-containing protein [bacterium]
MLKHSIIIVIILAILSGCSKGDNPVVPGSQEITPDKVSQQNEPDHFLLGYFDGRIDLRNEAIEMVPMRTSEMHLNISKFIENPITNLSISNYNIDWDTSIISVDIGFTHPLAGFDEYAGFDMKGIFITKGTRTGFEDPSIVISGDGETRLLNPDGMSRWWNPVEFQHGDNFFSYRDFRFGIKDEVANYECTLNAYKLYADDLSVNEDIADLDLLNRAVTSPGATNTRHYEVFFPKDANDEFIIQFNFAIDVCWEPIPGYVPGQEVDIPGDYPPVANQPEPFRIDVSTDFNSIYYENESTKGGMTIYNVKVYDWQGYLGPQNVADEIGEVKFECPEVLPGSYVAALIDVGAGSKAYAEYEIQVDGHDLTGNGDFNGLISAISSNGDYQDTVTGFSGDVPLASYISFPIAYIAVEAPPPNIAPVAVATANTLSVYEGDTVIFDASGSSDSDGIIVSYKWDFNGDGTYGDIFSGGTMIFPEVIYSTAGVYNVDLMVKDDDGDTDTLDTPLQITVLSYVNLPPIASAIADQTDIDPGDTVTFDASGSSDPDGTIVLYSWDFNNDGIFGDSYDSGTMVMPAVQFNNPGNFPVYLKVTDNDSAEDILDIPIIIHVGEVPNIDPIASAVVVGSSFWAGDLIQFNASASHDIDGYIVSYLWDFDEDGIYGDPIDGGTEKLPKKIFTSGIHNIDVKVVDNSGGEDTLDVPISINVGKHVEITLAEDQAFKSANGYNYLVQINNTPADIPVDYTIYGNWDFTGLSWLPDPDQVILFPSSDPEVSSYVPMLPSTPQYFIRYDIFPTPDRDYFYLAEEADFVNNLLYVYGHVEREGGEVDGMLYDYSDSNNGPIAIQYPWTIGSSTEWHLDLNDNGPVNVVYDYTEVAVAEGLATVPFNGVWDTDALLTRTFYKVRFVDIDIAWVLIYKWTADDGRQIARLSAMNTTIETNFNVNTYDITGESRLVVLNEEF